MSLDPNAAPKLFYTDIEAVVAHREKEGDAACIRAFERIIERLLQSLTDRDQVVFHTLFARIIYLAQRYNLPRRRLFFLHTFRRKAREIAYSNTTSDLSDEYDLGLQVLCNLVRDLYKWPVPDQLKALLKPEGFYRKEQAVRIAQRFPFARILLTELRREEGLMFAYWEENPEEVVKIKCALPDRNAIFLEGLSDIEKHVRLPCTLHLFDIEVDDEGFWRPAAWVLEPDYLLDVTAVADCYKPHSDNPIRFLVKRYFPQTTSKAIVVGNVANFLLDQLVTDPKVSFKSLHKHIFKLHPLAFGLMDDAEVREVMATAQNHFDTIQHLVNIAFEAEGINREKVILEPSFFSQYYGLQGRLDLLHRPDDNKALKHIIELKSGSVFMANRYGINPSHYIQTLLYDLMVQRAFQNTKVSNFIFYSKMQTDGLRFAPAERVQQFEALHLRNRMIAVEHQLMHLRENGEMEEKIFHDINFERYNHLKGFEGQDIRDFESVWTTASPLIKKFIVAFSSFISREQRLSKVGIEGIEGLNGVAALWLNDLSDKEEQFEILHSLEMDENHSGEPDAILWLRKTDRTPRLANFRQGDLVVVYPGALEQVENNVLNEQIFKGTLVELGPQRICIRLRAQVMNQQIFDQHTFWKLEHDSLDSGYLQMYRGLYQLASADAHVQNKLLGISDPVQPKEIVTPERPSYMTAHQYQILQAVLSAPDYYLLWGPPGSGKTSVLLRATVDHLYHKTNESIVLLAYTNRAVDEICESIEAIGPHMREAYIRIGSRYSTQHTYRERLLDFQLDKVETRNELKQLLMNCRIVVATVASFQGKQELLQFKQFDRVIIDEASQMLEPQMVGILTNFKRFVLIGDHLQLPAVVQQSEPETVESEPLLIEIGLNNLRNSYFERMYRRAVANNWSYAYGCLFEQGRMHADLMAFPAQSYYNGLLQVIPAPSKVNEKQNAALPTYDKITGWKATLAANRVAFVATGPDPDALSRKIHSLEAAVIVELVQFYNTLYGNEKPSIGIISPYRAQIAQIYYLLEQAGLDPSAYSTDTVERYQGSARDIILISLCAHDLPQVNKLVSLSEEGVDRKLNVALTRARERIVLVGNPDILQQHPVFEQWITWAQNYSGACQLNGSLMVQAPE